MEKRVDQILKELEVEVKVVEIRRLERGRRDGDGEGAKWRGGEKGVRK